MKRIVVLFVVITVLLTACKPAIPSSTSVPQEPVQATLAPQEKVTVTVWDFGGSEFQWMDDIAIPAYAEKHPNVTINHVGVVEDELGLKLETAIAAGEAPDLVIFPPPRVIAAGQAMALDNFMATDGLKREDYCPIFNSDNLFAGASLYQDKVYGLPIDTNIWAMIYNKKLFKEAGLPELTSKDYIDFDTWFAYARAINKPAETLDQRVWGSTMFTPQFNSMNNYMSDPYVLGPDGRHAKGNADSDNWIHAFEVLTAAYKEDVTTETAGAMLADVQADMFLQGKLGMTYAAFGDAMAARDAGIDVGLTGQPVVTKGWTGNVGGWNTTYYMMAGTKHPEEAWQFLKFLSLEVPLLVPIGADALSSSGGLPGLPCYQPLLKEEKITTMIGANPLVADFLELQSHYKKPPFSPDIWAATDPFNNAFVRMTEGGEDVTTVMHETAGEAQDILDGLWKEFDALGK